MRRNMSAPEMRDKSYLPTLAGKLQEALSDVSAEAIQVGNEKIVRITSELGNLNLEKQTVVAGKTRKKFIWSSWTPFEKKDSQVTALDNKIKQLNQTKAQLRTLVGKLEKIKPTDITEIRNISELIDKAQTSIEQTNHSMIINMELKDDNPVAEGPPPAASGAEKKPTLSERIKKLDADYKTTVTEIDGQLVRTHNFYLTQMREIQGKNSLQTKVLESEMSKIRTLQEKIINQNQNYKATTQLYNLCDTLSTEVANIQETHQILENAMKNFREAQIELKNIQAKIAKDQNIDSNEKSQFQKKINIIRDKLNKLEKDLLKGEAPTREQAEQFAKDVLKVKDMIKNPTYYSSLLKENIKPLDKLYEELQRSPNYKKIDKALDSAKGATGDTVARTTKDAFDSHYAKLYDTISTLKNKSFPPGLTSIRSVSERAIKELEARQKKLDIKAEKIKKELCEIQDTEPHRGDKYRALEREYTQLAEEAKNIEEESKKLLEAIEENIRLGQLMQIPHCRLSKAEGITTLLEAKLIKAQSKAKDLPALTASLQEINATLNEFAKTQLLANWVLIENVYQKMLESIIAPRDDKSTKEARLDRDEWRELKEKKADLYTELEKTNFSVEALKQYIKGVARLIGITANLEPQTMKLSLDPKSVPIPGALVSIKIELK